MTTTMPWINVELSFDELFQAIAESGFDIAICVSRSNENQGSIVMNFDSEDEATVTQCINQCSCESTPHLDNPFIAKHQADRAELVRLGLDDMPPHERYEVNKRAEKLIKEREINNEDDRVKVYREVKQQYLEYKEYIRREDLE